MGLAALGIAKGDVCAIFAANSPEYVIAVLAIARLGAVVTTASRAYTKDDLAKQLRDSGARLLFTSQPFAPIWTQAIAGTAVERVVMFDDPGAVAAQVDAEVLRFDTLAAMPGTPPRVTIDPDDLVALPYSSGTTGLPKGVMLTHRNLVANILQTADAGHYIDGEDTTIAFLPFFHIYGLTIIVLMSVWAGVTVVVCEVRSRAYFDSWSAIAPRCCTSSRPSSSRSRRSVRRGPRLLVDPQAVLGGRAARPDVTEQCTRASAASCSKAMA